MQFMVVRFFEMASGLKICLHALPRFRAALSEKLVVRTGPFKTESPKNHQFFRGLHLVRRPAIECARSSWVDPCRADFVRVRFS
jgi:hypothetical protein